MCFSLFIWDCFFFVIYFAAVRTSIFGVVFPSLLLLFEFEGSTPKDRGTSAMIN